MHQRPYEGGCLLCNKHCRDKEACPFHNSAAALLRQLARDEQRIERGMSPATRGNKNRIRGKCNLVRCVNMLF